MNIIRLSQESLLAAKTKEPVNNLIDQIAALPISRLDEELVNDDFKKTFWINIYNAFTQIILTKNPESYTNRNQFFSSKQINVAGKNLSLDDIEHGLLRKSKLKWSMGYINKMFVTDFERQHSVEQVDCRIHFALNCGATSCPPIAFFDVERINQQLDLATRAYLTSEVVFKEENNTVFMPAMMSWFRGDFGGKKGAITLLKKYEFLPRNANPTIKFKHYNWKLNVANYRSE